MRRAASSESENSIAGRVADIHHLLPDSGLYIVGEHFLPIHFHVLGVPGARLSDVRTVRSHAHAFGQCRRVMRENGWNPVVSHDTAGAAREVAELGDPAVAAIAPPLAAELYGLQEGEGDKLARLDTSVGAAAWMARIDARVAEIMKEWDF